jgi:hypothetical protein
VGILAERLITHVLAVPELQPETAQIQENAR